MPFCFCDPLARHQMHLYVKFRVNPSDPAIGVVLVSLLLTLNIFQPCSSVSIVNFEQISAGWD